MAEESLNTPALTVKFKGFIAMKSVANDSQIRLTPLGDAFGSKVYLLAKDFVQLAGVLSPALVGSPTRVLLLMRILNLLEKVTNKD